MASSRVGPGVVMRAFVFLNLRGLQMFGHCYQAVEGSG